MYTGIARVYDRLNEDVDYEKWADYVTRLFNKYGCKPDLVLELACGTGSFAIIMSKKGYEMICVDISEEMLTEAGQKAEAAGQNILFLQQDMTSFELYGTVGAIVCLLDSVNHLQDMEDVKKMQRYSTGLVSMIFMSNEPKIICKTFSIVSPPDSSSETAG
jgi:ubiquinone/menaquinone biosynthesis C-methylase UbiE